MILKAIQSGEISLEGPLNCSGDTQQGPAFACHLRRFGSLIGIDPTSLAEATTSAPAKTPSRARRIIRRLL